MTRSYFEHVEQRKQHESVAFDVVEFTPEPSVEVVEHEVPPPELARLMTRHERIVTGCTRNSAERRDLDALIRALSGSTR